VVVVVDVLLVVVDVEDVLVDDVDVLVGTDGDVVVGLPVVVVVVGPWSQHLHLDTSAE
jgi:hypothetical protein